MWSKQKQLFFFLTSLVQTGIKTSRNKTPLFPLRIPLSQLPIMTIVQHTERLTCPILALPGKKVLLYIGSPRRKTCTFPALQKKLRPFLVELCSREEASQEAKINRTHASSSLKQKCKHCFILQTLLRANSVPSQGLGIQFQCHTGPAACLLSTPPHLFPPQDFNHVNILLLARENGEEEYIIFRVCVSLDKLWPSESCYYEICNNNSNNN